MIKYFGDDATEDEGLTAALELALNSGQPSGVVVFSKEGNTPPRLIQAPPNKQLH
jgi:hypothetical protein